MNVQYKEGEFDGKNVGCSQWGRKTRAHWKHVRLCAAGVNGLL